MSPPPFQRFDYLRFAKRQLWGAEHQLSFSGVAQVTSDEFFGDEEPSLDLLRWSDGTAALAHWKSTLAARYGVAEEHSLPALGASGGVFLAIAALSTVVDAGAAVAIESPAYGAFESAARLLGRPVVHVPRPAAAAYALDLDAVDAAFTGGAKILCLTDLQNPTGIVLTDAELAAVRDLAQRHDAWVVLDEVYRDFRPGDVGTAYDPDERVICLSSLTKVYGVSGPRLGWIFGPPDVLDRAESVVEIAHGVDPVSSLWIAALTFERADGLLRRGRRMARRGRPVIDAWIDATPRVSWTPPSGGITGLVKIDGLTDSHTFARRLREELDVQVVPGAYFGAEGHIRVSFGQPPARLQKALEVLALGIAPLAK